MYDDTKTTVLRRSKFIRFTGALLLQQRVLRALIWILRKRRRAKKGYDFNLLREYF